jgi:chromosome partitioning protein
LAQRNKDGFTADAIRGAEEEANAAFVEQMGKDFAEAERRARKSRPEIGEEIEFSITRIGGFMIICLVNQKGGVGKTTIAINLAYCISSKQVNVLLIDADPQGSVLQWQSIAGSNAFGIIHHPEADFHRKADELVKGYKHVVIDAPPGTGDITLSLLLASDLAIVPVGASLLDMFSTRETLDLIQEAKRHNRKLKGKLLISRKVVGTVPGKEARDALKPYQKKPYAMEIFKTEISHRIDHVRAMTAGLTVLEYRPDSPAAMEVIGLCKELF